jgi:hypothetical protein
VCLTQLSKTPLPARCHVADGAVAGAAARAAV